MNKLHDEDKTQNFVPLTNGTAVGHYEIVKKIGAGGMGEVYLAKDQELEREVALKFLPSNLITDNEVRTRFTREAKAAAKLNHPNIVTIYEVGEFNGRPYFAMEHVRGQTLQHFAQEKPLPLEKVFELISQICEGLAEAHSEDIVHRDIKSSNIVVGEKGRPRILDFGLATVKGEEKLTRTGSTIGTVAYMSPEQIAGKETDARSDIFSLGVVFYELVTGRTPFRRDNNSATMSAIANDEPEPMARYKSGVSEELERIVSKALRKDIKSRYQSVSDMLADLRNLTGPTATTVRTNGRKMVAVLPFENLGSPDDEYFADGITEEITSRLAVVSGMGVISRTSALLFKGSKKSIAEIGSELGVDYILEGTVRWARSSGGASRVRITPQLIHVSDDTHLWAERYDREINDIFEVQSDIAEKVIEQLNVTLLESEQKVIQAKPTSNIEAYDYFLKGKEHFNSMNYLKKDFEQAIECFEKAVEAEPDFALAYALMGACHSSIYFFGYDRTEPRIGKARDAIDKALEINPDLPEAYLAEATLYYHHKRELDKAMELANKAASSIPLEANWLRMAIMRRKGFISDAVQFARSVVESNPGNAKVMLEYGLTWCFMQEFKTGIEWIDKAIAASPESPNALSFRMMCELAIGNVAGALEQVARIPETVDTKKMIEIWIVLTFARKYEEALKFIDNFSEEVETGSYDFSPMDTFRSFIYKLMGEIEKSKTFAEKAKSDLESFLKENKGDARIHSSLALTLALYGDFERAIEHALTSMELYPVYKDAMNGTFNEYRFAQVLTFAGKYDEALDVIERIVGRKTWYTLPFFTLNPCYEPLENLPRMLKLKEKYAYQYPKSK